MTATSAFDRAVDRLDVVRRNGTTALARCPAHEDHTPSLSITEGDDGKVLLNCHAGCTYSAITEAAGMSVKDLFPPKSSKDRARTVARYPYVDENGVPQFEVHRTDPKGFFQVPANGARGAGAMAGVPLTLYRLPEVLAGIEAGRTVFVAEGEKDVDALVAVGEIATCGPMGAGKWHKVSAVAVRRLRGADVVIVADKDDAGRRHARDIAKSLDGIAADVTIVEAVVGKDAADHLGAGRTVAEFDVIASTDRVVGGQPLDAWLRHEPTDADDAAPPSQADYLRSRLMTTEQVRAIPPPAPLIDGYLYRDSLAVAYGASGVGKSFVVVDMAMSLTSREWWFGRRVTRGDVLYVVAEGASGVGIRANAWDQFHGTQGAVTWLPEAVNIYSPMWASALAEVVAELRPALVVLDTFARCIVGADENSAKDIGQAVANLDQIRRAAGSCVLVVHHSGKDRSAGARGSTALKGALETELEVVGGEGRLTLRNPKQKDVPEQTPLHLMLQEVPGSGSVVVVEALSVCGGDLPESAFDILEALRGIDVPGGVSPAVWLKAVEVSERTFYRHRSGLLEHGLIVNVGSDKQPKYRPREIGNSNAQP